MGEVWDLIKDRFKNELAKDDKPVLNGKGLMVGLTTDDGSMVHYERVQYVVVGIKSDTFLLARIMIVDGKPVLDVQSSFSVEPKEEGDEND